MFSLLKPGGELCIIELEGVVFNLYSANENLRTLLDRLQTRFPTDLYVGRKCLVLMEQAGFTDLSWQVEAVQFDAEDMPGEMENYIQRFEFARPVLEPILGVDTEAFINLYMDELTRPSTTLFYNKFRLRGRRP